MTGHDEILPFDAKTFAAKYGGVTIIKYQAHSIVPGEIPDGKRETKTGYI